MNLIRKCIEKPVIACVISLLLMILGVVGYLRLDMRFYPKQEIPVVQVRTYYQGASADLMESTITNLLENAFAGIDGIDTMSSSSGASWSTITLHFKMGGDFSKQVNEVRDKISAVRGASTWPSSAKQPTIQIGSNASQLLMIGFTDASKTGEEIRDFVHDNVLPVIQQVPGVGSVSLRGSSDYAMRIWLNATKMAALGITVADIQAALKADNIDFSAGSIRGSDRNYGVISDTRLKNPKDFANVILKKDVSGTVRLSNVADVKFGDRSFDVSPMRVNGKDGLVMSINPIQGANPITLAAQLRGILKHLNTTLPSGMQSYLIYDQSQFLHGSINETIKAIFEAVALVVLVIFLFLGSIRASIIPIATIPVSLIACFGVIYLFGFSINTMSLLGIVLAIGLVVDDAIVMLENIYRHVEEGMSVMQAALMGSQEIATAVIAMSLTLFSVYAPIGMVQGFSAKLFQEFAFTLAAAVVISGFVALTLTPMMCSRILTNNLGEGRLVKTIDTFFSHFTAKYQLFLGDFLKRRFLALMILIGIGVLGAFIYHQLPSEFLPQEDTGLFAIHVEAPSGSTVAYSDKYNRQIESMLAKIPSIAYFITRGGGSNSDFTVVLKPADQRHQTPMQLVAKLNKQLSQIPGVRASAYMPGVADFGQTGSDIDINLLTSASYQDLITPVNHLIKSLQSFPGLTGVTTNLKFDSQQYSIRINRDLAAELGVNIQDISSAISAMMGGDHITDIQSGKRSYEVILQMQKQDLQNFDVLSKLYVKGGAITSDAGVATTANASQVIPLSTLVTMTPKVGQGNLHHYNRFRSGVVSARLAPGYTESQVIDYINKQMPSVLSAKVQFSYSGKAKQFLDSQGSMVSIMVMALVFIYLVLSLQFTSFIDPLIILLVVPFSMIGAFIALYLTGGSLNMYSQIGLVTLIGMISKHGILITQFINNLREQGEAMESAIIDGASIRLRPILMTTAAMVFGALPLALASGPGSVGRHQIGWVIVGGLLLGTFFSLVLVPMAYAYLGRYKKIRVDALEG